MIFELLALSLAINVFVFLFAYKFQTDKLTDITYTLTFILVALFGFLSQPITLTKIIIMSFVTLWGLRLGTYLGMRIHRIGRDKRFDDMRSKFLAYLGFWILQGLAVWLILIPTSLIMSLQLTTIDIMTYIGVAVWLIGFFFEAVGDYQMNQFYKTKRKKNEFIKTGLWGISRHPNYFGEILSWIGIYFICLSSLSITQSLISLISPIFIIIVIVFLTGLPQNEAAKEKKYGHLESYKKYKEKTAILIPGIKS